MEAPSAFVQGLHSILGEDYRVRWSFASRDWHIEQRVGPRRAVDGVIANDADDHIRARDGYWLVMRVRDGDRMPCPDCQSTLRVPVRKIGEATCDWCRAQGKTGRHTAAFWPLDDSLLMELKRTRPENAREIVKAADERNRLRVAALQRDVANSIETGTKEHWTKLVGIPSVGYTGRETSWVDAPAPRYTRVAA
jgi:hypothetical protein